MTVITKKEVDVLKLALKVIEDSCYKGRNSVRSRDLYYERMEKALGGIETIIQDYNNGDAAIRAKIKSTSAAL